jgi:hypothetical protein
MLDPITRILYHSNIQHPAFPLEDVCLQSHFYYLDLVERKNMAMKKYEILITQAQYKSINAAGNTHLDLTFNHIIKDLIFYIQPHKHIVNKEYFNFSNKLNFPTVLNWTFDTYASLVPNNYIGLPIFPLHIECIGAKSGELNDTIELWDMIPKKHLLKRARILLNGIERVEWRDAKYFYNMQNFENYQNHLESYIYLYSFNINPRSFFSNSGCNFSRIDNAQLQIELNDNIFSDTYELKCLGTNYNILVIQNGLAGIKYTN